MKLCKSEGLKGNIKSPLHSSSMHRNHREYCVGEATTAYETPRSKDLTGLVPLQLTLTKIKALNFNDNKKIQYGFVNRSTTNRSTFRGFKRAIPPPPTPIANTSVHHKNIFPNFGGSNVH